MELKRLSSTASAPRRPVAAPASSPVHKDRVELGGARALAEASVAGHRSLRDMQVRLAPRPASAAGLAVADHLCEPAQVRSSQLGIYAGHRPPEFHGALENNGVVTESFKPEAPIAGTETHRYRLNTKTPQGTFDGGLGAKQHTKTTFEEQSMPRERLGRLADTVFEHAPSTRNGYVQYGNDLVYTVREAPGGAPRTLGFETTATVGSHNLEVVQRPASELRPFTTPEMPGPGRWSRAAGAASKGLASLGVVGGGLQAWTGAETLAHAHSGREALDGAADLTGGHANALSGAGALAGAEALASRCGALGAVVDGGRDVIQGLTSEHRNPERAGIGLLKTTVGIAMALPGGALVGGALYAGTLVYEHREALGEAMNTAWNAVTEWIA